MHTYIGKGFLFILVLAAALARPSFAEDDRRMVLKAKGGRFFTKLFIGGEIHDLRLTDWDGESVGLVISALGSEIETFLNGEAQWRFGNVRKFNPPLLIPANGSQRWNLSRGDTLPDFAIHPWLPFEIREADGEYTLALGMREFDGIAGMRHQRRLDKFEEAVVEAGGGELLLVRNAGAEHPHFALRLDGVRVPVDVFTRGPNQESRPGFPELSWLEMTSGESLVLRSHTGPPYAHAGPAEWVDAEMVLEAAIDPVPGISFFPIRTQGAGVSIVADLSRHLEPDWSGASYLQDELEIRFPKDGSAPEVAFQNGGEVLNVIDGVSVEVGGVFDASRNQLAGREDSPIDKPEQTDSYIAFRLIWGDGVRLAVEGEDPGTLVPFIPEMISRDRLFLDDAAQERLHQELLVLEFDGRRPNCCWISANGKLYKVPIQIRSNRSSENARLVYNWMAGIWEIRIGDAQEQVPIAVAISGGVVAPESVMTKPAYRLTLDPRVSLEFNNDTGTLVVDVTRAERTELWLRRQIKAAGEPVGLTSRRAAWLNRFEYPGLIRVYGAIHQAVLDVLSNAEADAEAGRDAKIEALANLRVVFWALAERTPKFTDEVPLVQYVDDRMAVLREISRFPEIEIVGGEDAAHRASMRALLQALVVLGKGLQSSSAWSSSSIRSLVRGLVSDAQAQRLEDPQGQFAVDLTNLKADLSQLTAGEAASDGSAAKTLISVLKELACEATLGGPMPRFLPGHLDVPGLGPSL